MISVMLPDLYDYVSEGNDRRRVIFTLQWVALVIDEYRKAAKVIEQRQRDIESHNNDVTTIPKNSGIKDEFANNKVIQ